MIKRTHILLYFLLLLKVPFVLKAQNTAPDLFLPSQIEEYDWNENSWIKVSDSHFKYYADGKTKNIIRFRYNIDGSTSREIIDYDTLIRVTNLFVSVKPSGSSNYLNDYHGTNCYIDFFHSCGNSGAQWDKTLNKWIYQYGRRNQPVLSATNQITGFIWENWDNNYQKWILSEKEEYIYDNEKKLNEIVTYTWNETSASWIKSFRLHQIKNIPARPTLFSYYIKQIWNENSWKDQERYTLSLNGKTAYEDLTEVFENNSWKPYLRNQLFENSDFTYERYIGNKWVIIERSVQYPLQDHHQRYTLNFSGDTIIKHYHKRWYDHKKNTLRYLDYTNSGFVVYYEEDNEILYDQYGYLSYYIQNTRSSESEAYRKKKKFVYRNYINVQTGNELGKKDVENTDFTLFPNPSSNGAFSLYPITDIKSKYFIYTIDGKLVLENYPVDNFIHLEELPNGTYLFTMDKIKKLICIVR